MPEAIATKSCTICGIDCTNRPRVKDQKGRYMCQECFDKAKKTKQIQKSPPPAAGATSSKTVDTSILNDNSFLLDMGSSNAAGTGSGKACPECGRVMSAHAVVCIGCGYNATTGKRLNLKIEKPKKIKQAKAAGGGGPAIDLSSGPAVFLIVLALMGVGIGLGFVEPTAGMVITYVVSFAVGVWVIVEAFKLSLIAGLASIFLPLAGVSIGLFFAEDARVRWALLASRIGTIAQVALMVSGMVSKA